MQVRTRSGRRAISSRLWQSTATTAFNHNSAAGVDLRQLPGDCNGDGQVTINELVKGVRIGVGDTPMSDCASFDRGGDGAVAIDDLLAAVNMALNGCP